MATRVEVQWGVLYHEAERFHEAGSVESFGTRPGGDFGPFDQGVCEYIAGTNPNRTVVSRTVTTVVTATDWY